MRKLFLLAFVVASYYSPIFAENVKKDPVILVLNNSSANTDGNKPQRAPMRVPSLYIEGHTLSFSSACVGYTLELVKDDEEVYTYFIQTDDDLVLPSTLSGQYEIRLVGGSFTFVGMVEL